MNTILTWPRLNDFKKCRQLTNFREKVLDLMPRYIFRIWVYSTVLEKYETSTMFFLEKPSLVSVYTDDTLILTSIFFQL